MPLPPLPEFLRRKAPERPLGPAEEGQAIQAARTRARQRLVGALVLLVVGVVTFPLLFETQPRPLAVDTPIKLSQRDAGVVGGQPPAVRTAPSPAAPLPEDAGMEAPASSAASGTVKPLPPPESTAVPASAPVPVAVPAAVSGPASAPAPAPAAANVPPPKPAASAAPRPEPRPPANKPADEPKVAASASAPAPGRFVVQVGAFSDNRTLREARQKVEGLGLKSYTQVIDSSSGQRTRVRVGPFESRAEAEAAAKTLKGGGLPAAILTL